MGLAPFLYAAHIVRPSEVVAVLRNIEPTLLACSFGGLAAFELGAISLPSPVSMVGGEEISAARTLGLSRSFCH
jgi:hypothetical protein